ncbi:hypothetical protein ES708_32897 [subsurface metagenome]
MSIANYSTEVAAIKSVGEIQGMLVAHGAQSILMNYASDKTVESLSFIIDTPHGEINIRLPVKPEAILKIMEADPGIRPGYCNHEQSVKVAWRILKDWVRAQMAILETEMVQMEQIFLPYMTMRDGQTLYEVFEQKGNLLTGD